MTLLFDNSARAAYRIAVPRAVGLAVVVLVLMLLLTRSALAAGSSQCFRFGGGCGLDVADLMISRTSAIDPARQRDADLLVVATQEPVEFDAAADAPPESANKTNLPWYRTTLGIAGIGMAATAALIPFDRDVNRFGIRHVSANFRDHTALDIADGLTDASLLFAGATIFQSPWSSARLAHASSVAATATVITTAEVFGLKFAFGRERPGGPGSSPYQFHPFSSRYDLFSGAALHFAGGNTASFPSGHTAVAFSVITPYAEVYHQPWLYTIPVAIGLSRIVAVDGHWASDVVAGGLVGWLTADLTLRFFPDSDFGVMIFGNRLQIHKAF